ILGAGSAGCGIAEQIIAQMRSEGLSEVEARDRIFMVDRSGLMTDKSSHLLDFQSKLQQSSDKLQSWGLPVDKISLLDAIRN
ncbi:MAG: NAD-dependent malic enzyme, partial [Candidatus Regiella insecticola]|nr:NAD-dependent malic enzyme [Candidatus Regiella insecticola]